MANVKTEMGFIVEIVINAGQLSRYGRLKICVLGAIIGFMVAAPALASLSLERAIAMAQQHDPWLVGSEHRERALEAQSISAGSLPDPMVSAGFANLPTDSFDFNQEAMTQFKLGLSQVFPRGDSRGLQQKQLRLMGGEQPYHRDDRRAQVTVRVSHLWLDAYRARESIRLIEKDRGLFEHLVDVAQSNYSTALAGTSQQDLVRAQLELTLLEDRLTVLHEQLEVSRSMLTEWLLSSDGVMMEVKSETLPDQLPKIVLTNPGLFQKGTEISPQDMADFLQRHPAILRVDQKIAASRTGIELAEQKYQPQWRVNASYGYRDDDPMGNDRSDFFSMGVAFDLPLFTSKRQDQQVQSAAAESESVRTERALILRRMIAEFDSQRSRLHRLEQRRELYRTRLLEEIHEQAEASLTAYTNDDGDFAEVVRARIAELNARVDALNIDVDRLKIIAQLNYFFATASVSAGGKK
ncbi:MAG: TolC family protein [Halioglobus sp.]